MQVNVNIQKIIIFRLELAIVFLLASLDRRKLDEGAGSGVLREIHS